MSIEKFKETIAAGYPAQGSHITLGGAMYEGTVIKDLFVNIPLKNLNRHGLIAGATGTGKTKTLQALTENLSKAGVPTLRETSVVLLPWERRNLLSRNVMPR